MPTLLYGNKRPISCTRVSSGYGVFDFRCATKEEFDEFFNNIDSGLVIVKTIGELNQRFRIPRKAFLVSQFESTKTHYVKLTDPLLVPHAQWLLADEFVHLTPSSAITMASELSSTILHMLTGHFKARKTIRVFHRAPVEAFAHVVLKNIGLSRIKKGLSRDEFYKEFTPELAEHELKRILRKADLSVQFIPYSGNDRPAYCSLFGQNIIEFAEQANVQ